MARINFYRNAFEDKYEEQEYDFSKSLIKNIEQWSNEIDDIEELVECYDVATRETFFAPLDDSDEKSVLIIVNGQSVSDTYKVQECDVINVIFLPLSSRYFNAGSMIGAGIGMFLMGMLVAFAPYSAPLIASGVSGWLATTAGTMTALLGGAAIGYLAVTSIYNKMHQTFSSSNGKDSSSMPDVRGGSNESLVNNPYPFVIGKHLVNPRICAFPYTEYTGERGENAYIRIVYCIGYAPLKLTDFKLGDFILAYNRTQGVARETVINGVLKGYSTQEVDDGDILDYWKNNDIELEILQHKPNSPVNYGHIFPDKITEQEINAPVLFVNDDTIAEAATVTYKGVLFPKRFRTNGVFFTESCPM